MNSLQELNNYSATPVEYTDTRLPKVIFDRDLPGQAPAINILEGVIHDVPTVINVVDIANYQEAVLTYIVDLTNCPGATIDFGTLPAYMVETYVDDVYTISGFRSRADWELIKESPVTLPFGFVGQFEYSVKFDYLNETVEASKQYSVFVSVENVETLSQPLDYIFNISSTANILNHPVIQENIQVEPTYTVTITPSNTANINTFTSAGTGGTSNLNNSTKVLTISGTKAQVNSHLAALQLGTTALEADFTLTYTVSNNLSQETDTKVQILRCSSINFLGNPANLTLFYNEDTQRILADLPIVRDLAFDGSGTYTYTIFPSTTSAVSTLSSTGSGGSSSFNNSTKTLTITGTRAQVNSHLLNVSFTPATDYALNFVMNYRVITPRGASATATKFQNLFIGSNDTEVTNMNVNRSYSSNQHNFIFASNTPFISDLDTTNPNYSATLTISGSLGGFSFARNQTPQTTLSWSGTKSQVNAVFAGIVFYPLKGVSANGTFTYTQRKNGVVQVTQTVSLTGSVGTFEVSSYVWGPVSVGNFSWTPTFEEVRYVGVARILIVGGGGGGGLGGGGGGGVRLLQNYAITQKPYSITVGTGGAAGNFDISIVNPPGVSVFPGDYRDGQSGGDSSFDSNVAVGGGGGVRAGGPGGGYGGGSISGNGGGSAFNSTNRSGGTGYVTTTIRRGGGGASPSAVGQSASQNASLGVDQFGGNGGAGYTFDQITYSAGGKGGYYDQVNGQAVSGSAGVSLAGGGGAGNIGGTAIHSQSGTQRSGLPLATAGQNGRVKIWIQAN